MSESQVERKGWRCEGCCKRVWQKSPGRAVQEGFKKGVYEWKHAGLLREAYPRLRLSFSILRSWRNGWKNEGTNELPKRSAEGSAKGWGSLHQERFKNGGIAVLNGSALFRFKGTFEGEAKLKLS